MTHLVVRITLRGIVSTSASPYKSVTPYVLYHSTTLSQWWQE